MDFKPYKMGKYLLLERLAAGGMAEVYRAKATGASGFEKQLAIKKILPNHMEDQTFQRMFETEARIGSSLQQANIVQILDFVKVGETFLLVMEFVNGKNLRQVVNKLKKLQFGLPLECCLYIINETCKGLDYAHSKKDEYTGQPQNIIHRDMSPQNIMISFEGSVKIVDFGIANWKDKLEQTKSGVIKGKFGYMSPEQAVGQGVTHCTDIFSTGIILWELCTGKRLFAAESDFATLKLIQDCVIPKPSSINPKVNPDLEKIVLKALSKQASHRYQTAGAMQRHLQEYLNKYYPTFGGKELGNVMQRLFKEEIETDKKRNEQLARQSVPFSQGDVESFNVSSSSADIEEPLEGSMTNSVQDMVSHVTFIDEDKEELQSLAAESEKAPRDFSTRESKILSTGKSESESPTQARTKSKPNLDSDLKPASQPSLELSRTKPEDSESQDLSTQEKTKVADDIIETEEPVKTLAASPTQSRLQEITSAPARVTQATKKQELGNPRETEAPEKTGGHSIHLDLETQDTKGSRRSSWDPNTESLADSRFPERTGGAQNRNKTEEKSSFPAFQIVAGLALLAVTGYFYHVLLSGKGVIPVTVIAQDPRFIGSCDPQKNKSCSIKEMPSVKEKTPIALPQSTAALNNCEVHFESDPPGARVLIDGAEKITTPGTTLVPCDTSVNYSLQLEDYETISENILVKNKQRPISKTLKKVESGSLALTVDRRVKIFLETDFLGEAEPGRPFIIEKLRANQSYRIHFLNEIFGIDRTLSYTVKPGVTSPFDVQLDDAPSKKR